MSFGERESVGDTRPIGSDDEKNDLFVITPPPTEFTDIDTQVSRQSKNRLKGIWRFPSHNNETRTTNVPDSVRRKSNSMPSSRSLGNLTVLNEGTVSPEKPQLQIPKMIKRTSSVHEKDRQRHLSDEKPRSRTPQPVRKIFARTRSSSPHSVKHNGSWTLPRDVKIDTDTESSWSKTMKFLGRKAASSPFSLNTVKSSKESQPTNLQTQGITELGENLETAGSSSTADLVQCDGVDSSGQVTSAVTAGSAGASNDMPGDVPDGAFPSNAAQREHLRQKIMKISEQIKIEQGMRDENVAEYLRLSHTADKHQAVRMKSVFEKKNLKSKAAVAQLQKKLDSYHRRLKELDSNGKTLGGKFKDVQAKLNDISGGVASSVQGMITNKLGKTSKKFPSVDNIPSSLNNETHGDEDIERSNSLDNVSAATSESGEISAAEYPQSTRSLPPQPPSPHPEVAQMKDQLAAIQRQLEKFSILEARCMKMENELDNFMTNVKQNITSCKEHLGQSNDRYSILSGQMHDLTELHRREMEFVKQDLASLEEKLEYHAQERARDIQEALETCQTRISKMEVQQQHQHQQLVTMEGFENATVKALAGKLINLLLSVLAVLLVFVSTVSSIMMPFVRNQTRIIITGVCVLLIALLYRNWTALTLGESWWRR